MFDNWIEYLIIINASLLVIAKSNQPYLILFHITIGIKLDFMNFYYYNIHGKRQLGYHVEVLVGSDPI